MAKILVIGAGVMGTAITVPAVKNGHDITLVGTPLDNEIIEFVSQSQKIMPHFHIPLQSGSDKILKLMKRRYLSELYVDRVNKIKELIPDCCIGADVIVGFPGENDIDFKRTYDFISN